MLRKIIFCLILLAAFPVFAQERVTVQTDEAITAWREDLARLESAMQEIHPNLYWRFPQTVFQQAFAELDAIYQYERAQVQCLSLPSEVSALARSCACESRVALAEQVLQTA